MHGFDAGFMVRTLRAVPGVPIKNTIDQSQELGLCIFALCPVALTLFGQRRFAAAAACAALILAFFASLISWHWLALHWSTCRCC
jgi:hypothetical protein